jgi:hypothetical protein
VAHVGGRWAHGEHEGLRQQEKCPGLGLDVAAPDRAVAVPIADGLGDELLGDPLHTTDSLENIGEHQLGVAVQHGAHEGIGAQCLDRGDGHGDQPLPRGLFGRVAGAGEQRTELPGHQRRDQAADVGEAAVEGHPADPRGLRDVGERGPAHAVREHAAFGRVQQDIVVDPGDGRGVTL